MLIGGAQLTLPLTPALEQPSHCRRGEEAAHDERDGIGPLGQQRVRAARDDQAGVALESRANQGNNRTELEQPKGAPGIGDDE